MPNRKANITASVCKNYLDYLGVILGDQNTKFAPHSSCKSCVENLRLWSLKTLKSQPFGIPMIWRESADHVTDCYLCMNNIEGL